MRVQDGTRALLSPRNGIRRVPHAGFLAVLLALLLTAWSPSFASAHDTASHSLAVTLTYPDDGVGNGEQLCLALFKGTDPNLDKPPLLSRCLDPGGEAVTFDALPHGDYSVLVPGPGSKLAESRYQGQLVATAIPDEDQLDAFGIGIDLSLAPEYAGTTGRVQVNVFGCPAGTKAGTDEQSWAAECHALAGGVPLTLTGTGSIQDAAFQGVTGSKGPASGRVEFTDLPPGAYELNSDLPKNVASDPALFAESSIDGSLGSIDSQQALALRPTETVAVDVYLVLDPAKDDANSVIGLTDATITGGVAAGSPTAGASDLTGS